uniref:Uncharacterized protein n=1 Tax=Steinernema glaseri TaxID=37863 RepID=A0A1I8A4N3_9BILA
MDSGARANLKRRSLEADPAEGLGLERRCSRASKRGASRSERKHARSLSVDREPSTIDDSQVDLRDPRRIPKEAPPPVTTRVHDRFVAAAVPAVRTAAITTRSRQKSSLKP